MSAPSIPIIQYRVQASFSTLEFWWGPPKNANGSITSYNLICSTINNATATTPINVEVGPSSFYAKVSELTNGNDYAFQLAANNENGTGPYAVFALAQPGLAPGGPTNVRASTINNNLSTAIISWEFSKATDEGANKYFVLRGIPSTSTASISSFVMGLYPDQRSVTVGYLSTMFYTFLVQSLNDAGYSFPNRSTQIYVGPDRHWFPTQMSSLSLWMDGFTYSSITFYSGTSTIQQWNDKSAYSINYISNNAGSAPTFDYDSVLDKNGLFFRPGGNLAGLAPQNKNLNAFSTNSSEFTIFTVHRYIGYTIGQFLWQMNPSSSTAAVFALAGDFNANFSTNTIVNSSSMGTWDGIGCYTANTDFGTRETTLQYFANGSLVPTSPVNPLKIPSFSLTPSFLNLGMNAYNAQEVPTGSWGGWIYEVLVYQYGLTGRDRQIVEGYLASKWGISNRLPTNHPYYLTFPLNTDPMESHPTSITNVIISNLTATGFTISWTGAIGAEEYHYLVNGSYVTPTTDNGLAGKNATFTGLTSGQSIEVIIIADSNRGVAFSGTVFNPSSLSPAYGIIRNWYDASDPLNGTRATLGNLPTWFDKSGNSNNATATNGTPTLGNDGKNFITFPGSSYYDLPISSWMYNNNLTVFFVAQGNSSMSGFTNSGNNITLHGDNYQLFVRDNGIFYKVNNATRTYDKTTVQITNNYGNFMFTSWYRNNNDSNLAFNSFEIGGAGSGSAMTSGAWRRIGGNTNNSETWGSGKFREIIAFQGDLDGTRYRQVEGYLAWKWGLQNIHVAGNMFGAYHYYILGTNQNFNDNGSASFNSASFVQSFAWRSIAGRSAIHLDQGNSKLSFPLPPASATYTYAFWAYLVSGSDNNFFNITDTSNARTEEGHGTGYRFNAKGFFFESAITNVLGNISPSTNWTPSGNTPMFNCWHHFAFVINANAGTLSVYANGIFVATSNGLFSGLKYNRFVNFGDVGNENRSANFYLTMVTVHTSAFTQSQITQLYNASQNALPQNHPHFNSPPYVYATAKLAPFTLTASDINSSGFTISWTGPTGVTSYVYEINGSTVTPATNNGMTSQNAIFTGLAVNTPYVVVVRAVIGSANTIASSPLTVTINPPTAITNLTVYDATTTSFSVRWQGGVGATSYRYSLTGNNVTPSTDAGLASKSATFTGLTTGNTYAIVVTAISSSGTTTSGTFWLPTEVAREGTALYNWYDANDPKNGTVVNVGTNITLWNDKSGYAFNALLQGGSGTLSNDGYNYINFDDTHYEIPIPTWMFFTPLAIFIVFSYNEPTNFNRTMLFGGQSTNEAGGGGAFNAFVESGNPIFTSNFQNGTGFQSRQTFVPNTSYLVEWILSNATAPIQYLGGMSANQSNYIEVNRVGIRYIGRDDGSRNAGLLDGRIREILMFRNWSNTNEYERTRVEGYLAWKWGLQAGPYGIFNPQTYLILQNDFIDRGSNPQMLFRNGVGTDTRGARLAMRADNSVNNLIGFPLVWNRTAITFTFWVYTNDTGVVNFFDVNNEAYGAQRIFPPDINTSFHVQMHNNNFSAFINYAKFSDLIPTNENANWGFNPPQMYERWHHVAFTYRSNGYGTNNGTAQVYYDGVGLGSKSIAGYITLTGFVSLLNAGNGSMQYYCQYDSELTTEQINTIIKSQATSLQQNHPYFSAPPNTSLITTLQAFTVTLTSKESTSFVASWTPLLNPQGITSYTYTLNGASVTPAINNGMVKSSVTFTGLTTGQTYALVVTAVGVNGSFSSNTLNVTLGAAPSPITNLFCTTNTLGSTMRIEWSGGVGATSYNFTLNGVPATPNNQSSSHATWEILIDTCIYTFVVIAVNSNGTTSSTPYFSPDLIGGLENWYDAFRPSFSGSRNYGSNFNAGNIVAWYDRSGKNRDAFVLNRTNDPCQWSNDTSLGQSVSGQFVSFTNNTFTFPQTNWMLQNYFAIFIVMQTELTPGSSYEHYPVGARGSGNPLHVQFQYNGNDGGYTFIGGNGGNVTGSLSPTFNRGIFSYYLTPGVNWNINRAGYAYPPQTGQSLLNPMDFGGNGVNLIGGGPPGVYRYKGKIHEILAYKGDISSVNPAYAPATNVQVIEAYLAYKWGHHSLAISQGIWAPQTHLVMFNNLIDTGTNPVTVTNNGVQLGAQTMSNGRGITGNLWNGASVCDFPISLAPQFTISFFVYNTAGNNVVLSLNPGTNNNDNTATNHQWTSNSNQIAAVLKFSGGDVSINAGNNTFGKWVNHVAVTVDTANNNRVITYWNGVESNTANGSGSLLPINHCFLGGAGGNRFSGSITYFSIHNRALTASQVKTLYVSQLTALPQNHPFFSRSPQNALTLTILDNTAITSSVASNVSSRGVTLTWSGGNGSGWGGVRPLAYIYTFNGVAVKAYEDYGPEYNFATFTGLNPNTTYNVVISAVWSGNGTRTTNLSFTTLMVPISSLSSSAVTTSGFTINWVGGTGATSYSYTLNNNPVTPSTDNGVSGNNAVFTGLSAATTYVVTVTATNAFGSISYPSTKTLWLDGKDPLNSGTAPSNGTSITTWFDKSGRGNNNSSISGTTPTYVTSNNSIVFSGSNYYSYPAVSIPTGDNSLSIFIVALTTAIMDDQGAIFFAGTDGSHTGLALLLFNPGKPSMVRFVNRDLIPRPNIITANTLNLFEFHGQSGGLPQIYNINGYQADVRRYDTPNLASVPLIVGGSAGRYANKNMNGNICEFIIFNTCLSIADRQRVQGYLAWKYGIQSRLATNNPYFSAAPTDFVPGFSVKTN